MNYINKNINGQNKVIIPPSPDEILEENFDYPKYIERIVNIQMDQKELENLYYNLKVEPVDPKITKLFKDFEQQIIKIQTIYENDLKAGTIPMDYNEEMQTIAKKFFQKLNNHPNAKLEKDANIKALTAKREELLNALNQVLKQKANVEENSLDRLKAFTSRKIPLGKLYIYDLINFRKTAIDRKYFKGLEKYRLHVLANLISEEGIYTKPIENLHFQGKK